MSAASTVGDLYRIVHIESTHAPLRRRYMGGEFTNVGKEGEYARIDPETGAEFRALGGSDHRYNKDYQVGGSYPETVFVYGADGEGNSVDHEALEAALREHGLWSDALKRVILPKGTEHGKATWWYGFQFRPPNRAPNSMKRLAERLERRMGEDAVMHLGKNVELYV